MARHSSGLAAGSGDGFLLRQWHGVEAEVGRLDLPEQDVLPREGVDDEDPAVAVRVERLHHPDGPWPLDGVAGERLLEPGHPGLSRVCAEHRRHGLFFRDVRRLIRPQRPHPHLVQVDAGAAVHPERTFTGRGTVGVDQPVHRLRPDDPRHQPGLRLEQVQRFISQFQRPELTQVMVDEKKPLRRPGRCVAAFRAGSRRSVAFVRLRHGRCPCDPAGIRTCVRRRTRLRIQHSASQNKGEQPHQKLPQHAMNLPRLLAQSNE